MMGTIDLESVSQWGGDVLTMTAAVGCVSNSNVK